MSPAAETGAAETGVTDAAVAAIGERMARRRAAREVGHER
jgi:hypothetical protein